MPARPGAPPDGGTDYERYLVPSRGARAGRTVDVSEALRAIPDGARVYVSPFCGTPVGLLEALDDHRAGWSSLELAGGALLADIAPLGHPGEPFRFTTWQMSRPYEAAAAGGALDVIPLRYSRAAEPFLPDGRCAVDVALVQVSPPGPDGRFSLGVSVGAVVDIVRSAPLVIAQVNREMPYTFGAGELSPEAFDYLVELDGPLVESPPAACGPEEEAIGEHVAGLVPDGATLEAGLGAVPEAVLARLGSRHDLGVHSGMIGDAVVDLVEGGAVTNARKPLDTGVIVTAEAIGSRHLFRWLDRNPTVRFAPARYTHSLDVLRACPDLRLVNSAIEVALDGAVNAESIGQRAVAGPGGQPDFAEAALQAADAVSIVALRSTAAGGKRSRIVRCIEGGAAVTVARHLADRVVTEYGVASLRDRPLGARAEALRAIAHPRFRDELH